MPTDVKAWEKLFPDSFVSWKANFQKIYKITKDNKLRQFLFKLLHRITVTKRELKKIKITGDDQCSLCSSQDSILHTFLDWKMQTDEHPRTQTRYSPSIHQILFIHL